MFTPEDAAILNQPGSWEKVYALQTAFFPKLTALQMAANRLIYDIYKIDVSKQYRISQTPTISSRKGLLYNSSTRRNDENVLVGLRAKGKPSHLTRPDGKLCNGHFALLAFSVDLSEEGCQISTYFVPSIVRYAAEHLFDLSASIALHDLVELIAEIADGKTFSLSHGLPIFDLFQQRRGWLSVTELNLIQATQQDFAKLVMTYVACFPMLDLFTRISNGETVYVEHDEEALPVNQPNYAQLFKVWKRKNAKKYIADFQIQPLVEEDIWKSEAITRSLFEEVLGHKFPKKRPAWLKSGRNRTNLELDGYCQELKLAFEYQGEYHYMEIPVHHQNRSLQEIQRTDELKLKLCQAHGVDLIQVPFWEKANREYIVQALLSLNRSEILQIIRKPENFSKNINK